LGRSVLVSRWVFDAENNLSRSAPLVTSRNNRSSGSLAIVSNAFQPAVHCVDKVAQFVALLPGGSAVLVDSVDDGDFVFFMRQYDGSGRIVLRGSKVLYTFASYKGYGY
jgi:hypothetical protein